MKGLITYKGKYGATEQYAKWIAEELHIPVQQADEKSGPAFKDIDPLILGTSVYIGQMQLKKWLHKNAPALAGRKIFLCVVSGTPDSQKEKQNEYVDAGLPETLKQNCEVFHLPGRLDISKLSWKDRFMLKMGARLTRDPLEKKHMLTEYDAVKKENLRQLLDAINRYAGSGQPA